MRGCRVPPLSRRDLRAKAYELRNRINSTDTLFFKIVHFAEFSLPSIVPGFVLEIKDKGELKEAFALSYPSKNVIILTEDIYDGATKGNGFARFTLAHEIGHIVLHSDAVGFARSNRDRREYPIYEDSEWQANNFAAEFLMPHWLIAGMNTEQIMNLCGVSRSAATARQKIISRESQSRSSMPVENRDHAEAGRLRNL